MEPPPVTRRPPNPAIDKAALILAVLAETGGTITFGELVGAGPQ
ncbi:hypothetical protein [Nakamurella leprariae]|nr:hypothetical protein [Nakamurella leprariae]